MNPASNELWSTWRNSSDVRRNFIQHSDCTMSLPVSYEYLACALAKQKTFDDMRIREKQIADLHLPTGKLVACDAFQREVPNLSP